MSEQLSELLKKYVEDVRKLYGSQLKTVILYGSYVRGYFRPDSDIDIMILVDLAEEKITEKERSLSDIMFDHNFDNDLTIMPLVKNYHHFHKWIRAYPFYYHIKMEGVALYAAYSERH